MVPAHGRREGRATTLVPFWTKVVPDDLARPALPSAEPEESGTSWRCHPPTMWYARGVRVRRRVKKRFVVAIAAGLVLVALIGATIPTWYRVWPSPVTLSAKPTNVWSLGVGGPNSPNVIGMHDAMMIAYSMAIPGESSTVTTGGSQEDVEERIWSETILDVFPRVYQSAWAFERVGRYGWVFGCHLWIVRTVLAVSLMLAAWIAWTARPRWPVGHCSRCGYDLAGLTSETACPECGATRRA